MNARLYILKICSGMNKWMLAGSVILKRGEQKIYATLGTRSGNITHLQTSGRRK